MTSLSQSLQPNASFYLLTLLFLSILEDISIVQCACLTKDIYFIMAHCLNPQTVYLSRAIPVILSCMYIYYIAFCMYLLYCLVYSVMFFCMHYIVLYMYILDVYGGMFIGMINVSLNFVHSFYPNTFGICFFHFHL